MDMLDPIQKAAWEAGWRDCEQAMARIVRDAVTTGKLKHARAAAEAQHLFGETNGKAVHAGAAGATP